MQALLACHLAWMLAFAPVVVLGCRKAEGRTLRRIGIGVIALAGIAAAITLGLETVEWLRLTGGNARYLAQRLGLALVSNVDVPVIELCAVGALCCWRSRACRT